MKDHELILKLIEEVDPSDTAKLDEIDARVFCFIGNHVYRAHAQGAYGILVDAQFSDQGPAWATMYAKTYTRSRDALKAIRPEGLFPEVRQNGDGSFWALGDGCVSTVLPTEELAELHAILQAHDWERAQNETP